MADDSADTVVAFSVIEHLHRPQCLLAESFRMLRSGGSLVLQVPWQWGVHEAPYDYWRFTPYGLTRMLEQTGFVEVEIAAQGGFGSMWALKSSYILRRLARGPAWRRLPMSLVCVPCWFILQLLGPFVDRLDRDPQCETCGYTVRARRP
jgi:SAM-dependent methyltransferase